MAVELQQISCWISNSSSAGVRLYTSNVEGLINTAVGVVLGLQLENRLMRMIELGNYRGILGLRPAR
jgi:hypothetical protein